MTRNLVQPLFNMGPIRSLKKTMTPFSLLSLGFKGFSLSMPPAQNTLYKKPLDSMEENINLAQWKIYYYSNEIKHLGGVNKENPLNPKDNRENGIMVSFRDRIGPILTNGIWSNHCLIWDQFDP